MDKNVKIVNVLTEKISIKQNSIYTPTIKYAWEELKKSLNAPITKIDNSILNEINEYKFSQKPLLEDEIEKQVLIEDDKIDIFVEFNKSLPFKYELYINEQAFTFNKHKVCSISPKKDWVDLLYYKDDDNFALKITPKNENQEIIFIKKDFQENFNFKDELEIINNQTENIRINIEDTITIPIIEFDLESKYNDLVPVKIHTKKLPFIINSLKQKIKFTLNEKGAEVESIFRMRGAYQCKPNIPKHLELNKPFIVLLKEVDNLEPYFAMYASDSSFMKEFSTEYFVDSSIDKISF